MSSLVLGTAQFGLNYGINNKSGKISLENIAVLLKKAWEGGIRELDTARAYGDAEQVLGQTLKVLLLPFKVHSKFVLEGEKQVQDILNDSLTNLNQESLGFFYFHDFSQIETYLKNKHDDKILKNSAGFAASVYDDQQLEFCLQHDLIKAIQVPLNIFDHSLHRLQLIQQAQTLGKKIYFRSVFLQGLFFMDPNELKGNLKVLKKPLTELNNISAECGLSKRTLALQFVKKIISSDGILMGVDTLLQLEENLQSWNQEIPSSVFQSLLAIRVLDPQILQPKNWK